MVSASAFASKHSLPEEIKPGCSRVLSAALRLLGSTSWRLASRRRLPGQGRPEAAERSEGSLDPAVGSESLARGGCCPALQAGAIYDKRGAARGWRG